jgi:hypothetical protein
MTSDQCQSRLCVDGTCEPVLSPAPATSPRGLAAALAILVGLGAFGLRRLQRRTR